MSTGKWRGISGSLKRLGVWILILSIWEAAYRTVQWPPYVFPAPSQVLDAIMDMLNVHTAFGESVGPGWPWTTGPSRASAGAWYEGRLISAQLVSAVRLVIGFAISISLGGLLGLLMWRLAWLDRLLGPLFLGMQTLPSVCWVPLAVLIFGLNETGILFVLVMGSFFAVAIALRDGLKQIPPIYQRAGLMLGAKGWKLYRYVLLPAALPAAAGSLRQGFSFAWRSLMGAELVLMAQNHGLGYLLHTGRELADVAQVVAVMVIMIVVAMLVDRWFFARIQEKVQARFGLA